MCKLTLGVLVVTMEHSGFSPPEDHDSSMEHYTEGELGHVPAVSTVVRISRGNQRGGQRARTTHRMQPYADTPQPNQSSSSDGFPTPGPQLTAQQATFLAGAAVTHAHQASQVASHAANTAEFYQREAMQVREVAQAEITNARQTIHSIVAQAKAFVAEREGSLGQVVLEAQAQAVQVTEDQAMQAISAIQNEANRVNENLRSEATVAMSQAMTTINQQKSEIMLLREQEVETNRQQAVNIERCIEMSEIMKRQQEEIRLLKERLETKASEGIPFGSPKARPPAIPEHQVTPSPVQNVHVLISSPPPSHGEEVFGAIGKPPGLGISEPDPAVTLQHPGGAGTAAPSVNPDSSSSFPADPTHVSCLYPTSIPGVPSAAAAQPVAPKAYAPGGCSGSEVGVGIQAQIDQVTKMMVELATSVATIAKGVPASRTEEVPQPMSAPPKPKGSVLHLDLPARGFLNQDPPSPGSSSSSSSSEGGSPVPSPKYEKDIQCRVCGSNQHLEINCPFLTGNKAPQSLSVAASSSAGNTAKTPAEYEEEIIRVKSLNDLVLPNAPSDAGEARGYLNQVLMTIGKLQRTEGDEVYQWIQEVQFLEDKALKSDTRFPRLNREIAAKLIKVCKKGKFGLLFQQMVESERLTSGSMPNGRVMLRAIIRHFQLERDRQGMLGERNLLQLKLAGHSIADLETFRDKYIYILSAIPHGELPREQTMFNHLMDELEKSPISEKIRKAREAPHGSHRRSTKWIWSKVELAIELEQQKVNRLAFDKQLRQKPHHEGAGNAAPAAPANAKPDKPDKPPKDKKNKKQKKAKGDKTKPDVPAAAVPPKAAPKGPPKPKPKKSPRGGDTTPRTAEIVKVSSMTPAQKAKHPCMFYAFNSCKAKSCPFLHDANNKYSGPPPRSLKPKDGPPKAPAAAASVLHDGVASVVPAMTASAVSHTVPWLWDTAAGRHLFGRQAMTPAMKKCVRETDAPVSFSTGGGARPGNHTVGFEGSSIIGDEQVYVLDSCPPAQSIGKAVLDGGFLFVWDPRNHVPYMVRPKDVPRCKLKVPRDARVNATRVVEYVPQYDEHVTPRVPNEPRKTIPLEAQAASSVPLVEEDAVSFSDGVPVAWNREEVPVSLLKATRATQYRKDTPVADLRPKGSNNASPGIASKTEILAPKNVSSDVFKVDKDGNLYKLYHEAPPSSVVSAEYEKSEDFRERHRGFTRCLDPHAIGDESWHHPVRTVRERSRPPCVSRPQQYDISTPRSDLKKPPVAAPAEASSSSSAPPAEPVPKSPVEAESVSVPRGAEGAGSAAPKHQNMDDKLLVELGEGVPFRDDALKAEAITHEHLRTHFPKNPFCRICNISKNTSARVARKPDGRSDDGIDVPTQPMQQLATDDVILAMGPDHPGIGVGGVKAHHVIRDVYSGARIAYPITKRDIAAHAKNLRHFLGVRSSDKAPHVLVKHDEAQELEQACIEVGLLPETSLPNRWPHNAKMERDIREEKECTRAIHLQSGLPYSFHTHSFPFACLSLSFDRVDEESGKTQWEKLTRAPFLGRRLCFGQLCYYRKKTPTKRTLEPNMSPALFLGWRIDSGGRYRNVVKVLDYQDFRIRGLSQAIDVPEPELYVEDGPPVFPVAHARDQALLEGMPTRSEDEVPSLPDIDLKEVPFPPEGDGIAAPPTPTARKSRGVYITVERIIRFKETPGCKGCFGDSTIHTPACRERFTKLVEEEKEEARRKFEERARAEIFDEEAEPAAPVGEEPTEDDVVISGLADDGDGDKDEVLYEPTSDEEEGPPKGAGPVASASPVMLESSVSSKAALPTFGCPAQTSEQVPPQKAQRPWKVGNRRARRAAKRGAEVNFFRKGKVSTMYEFACSPDSMMGYIHSLYDIPHVRLFKDQFDLEDPNVISQLVSQLELGGPANLWGTIPCTTGSPWQRLNLHRGGEKFRKKLKKQIKESRRLFAGFAETAEVILVDDKGDVTFEWPLNCDGWNRDDVKSFFNRHRDKFKEVCFDGCAVGVQDKKGNPIRKPWKLMTTSQSVVDAFSDCKCKCRPGTHAQAAGSNTAATAFYPELMCEKIARALYPARVCQQVPCCPVVPLSSEQPSHREKDQSLKHVSPLAGEAFAVAVEADESAIDITKEVTEIMDLNGIMCDILGLPKEQPCAEVHAAVTKLLSRAEMLSSPEALQAVKAEADGLVSKGTWDLSSVREQDAVRSEAKSSGTSVHFGQLMTIASIKFHELAKHLQKVKGRIVYRGDAAKDELGYAAVYQELGANPTSVQGLNATLAYGSIPGHALSAADAVKAYVQASLKSRHKTWIQLPPELRPSWWREKFAKPVVLLVKALYGHPEAGGHWERHLKGIISRLGGEEIPEFPGNFFFPKTRLMLSTYVDDLTLAGPKESHASFWNALCGLVDVEPPEPIHRILGRDHLFAKLPESPMANEVESAALRAIDLGMVFDMRAYTIQTIDLYKECAKVDSVKPALTPFVAEGSLNPDEDEVTGTLAPVACKVLMKALWLARLARPDILKPIGDLASNVQKWSRNHDKQLLRLIQYLSGTVNHRLVGTIQDPADSLELVLYVDADFCGDRSHSKSTNGGYLIVQGPRSCFPLAWVSKRQTSTSRSTTESEVISLAHSLFAEGIPSLQLWERLLGRPVTLRVKEDNQATIKVVLKGFSPKLRHIQRTHKVNLGSLQEIFEEDTSSVLEYVETEKQAADIFTKGLVPAKWPHALALLGIRELPENIQTTKVAIPGLLES